MIDYFLKFQDEQEAITVLESIESGILATDTIGTIYKPVMQTDEDGNPIMEAISGWHVNVRSYTPIETLDVYKIDPEPLTPIRVWA